MTYQERKEQARREVQEWQLMSGEVATSWEEIFQQCAYFEKLAKRYGLIKEFKREGII